MNKEKYTRMNQEQLDEEFTDACMNGRLEIIKYLVESPELKNHANINNNENNIGFKSACDNGFNEIIRFLIVEKNMAISNSLKDWLKGKNHDNKSYGYPLSLIAIRDLKDKLDKDLEINIIKKVNPKI
jgi:hypothetical protein